MKQFRFTANRWFGLPALTLLVAGVMSVSACHSVDVAPQPDTVRPSKNQPATLADDDDKDKPPKDGHGGS